MSRQSLKTTAVEDDNVYTAPIMADKDILEFVQSSKKYFMDADSDDENEMNNVAPVPVSTEMRNVLKMGQQPMRAKTYCTHISIRDLGPRGA
ncbi:hypothetical protein TNCV_4717471 [Trichonephila clavipes]|nr:hypothetical protein TNCV_4717471 [Trichonephila clavipes]